MGCMAEETARENSGCSEGLMEGAELAISDDISDAEPAASTRTGQTTLRWQIEASTFSASTRHSYTSRRAGPHSDEQCFKQNQRDKVGRNLQKLWARTRIGGDVVQIWGLLRMLRSW